MLSEKDDQLVAILQEAGVVANHQLATLLAHHHPANGSLLQALIASGILSFDDIQALLLRYAPPATPPLALPEMAMPSPGAAAEPDHLFDERTIDDEQLQAFVLTRCRLTQAQLDTARTEQQHTGHPLWRTLINLQMLTPQDMMVISPQRSVARNTTCASLPFQRPMGRNSCSVSSARATSSLV